jgi:hypothetical protein
VQGLDREETEKMRRDYEYSIASLQTKVATLQEELDKSARVSGLRALRGVTDMFLRSKRMMMIGSENSRTKSLPFEVSVLPVC